MAKKGKVNKQDAAQVPNWVTSGKYVLAVVSVLVLVLYALASWAIDTANLLIYIVIIALSYVCARIITMYLISKRIHEKTTKKHRA